MKPATTDQARLRAAAKYILEIEIRMLHDAEDGNEREGIQEYARGGFHAAKWMASALLGERTKDEILSEIGRATRRPIPHIVGIARDGNRYGWDSDAG
jgi:hypothetical protein